MKAYCAMDVNVFLTKVESGSSRFGFVTLFSGQSLAPHNCRISSFGEISDPFTAVCSNIVDETMAPITEAERNFFELL